MLPGGHKLRSTDVYTFVTCVMLFALDLFPCTGTSKIWQKYQDDLFSFHFDIVILSLYIEYDRTRRFLFHCLVNSTCENTPTSAKE